jgi:hypothetical protein
MPGSTVARRLSSGLNEAVVDRGELTVEGGYEVKRL